MPEIDDETRQIIATLQRNLLQIKLTKKAPINLTQYRNMGLIRIVDRHKMHCGRTPGRSETEARQIAARHDRSRAGAFTH